MLDSMPAPAFVGGFPGGMELAILAFFLIPLALAYVIYRDVGKRNTNHPYAWPIMTFLTAFPYVITVIPFLIFYYVVRDEIGN